MNVIRIVAVISSPVGVTVYKEDGTTLQLPNTSYQTEALLRAAAPTLAKGRVFEVDLDNISAERVLEKRSGGLMRFVRMARDKVVSLFGAEVVEGLGAPEATEHTVAVVQTSQGERMVPGVEALTSQMDRAAFQKPDTSDIARHVPRDATKPTPKPITQDQAPNGSSHIGFQRFLERVAGVIDQRQHSMADLMNFLRRADLPIADDGRVIAYKRLNSVGDGVFVDPHSRSVKQVVGGIVEMPAESVDPDRRIECSHGLHVGRRAYMGSFSGDVLCMVAVAPEDFIAVPHNDPNKVRVRAYEILVELGDSEKALIYRNEPMTRTEEGARLLNLALTCGFEPPHVRTVLPEGNSRGMRFVDMNGDAIPLMARQRKTDGEGKAVALDEVQVDNKAIREVMDAAETGDMSAALDTEEPEDTDDLVIEGDPEDEDNPEIDFDGVDEPTPDPEPEKVEQPVAKPPKVAAESEQVAKRNARILDSLKRGVAKREIARNENVDAATIRRVAKKHGL